jgi:ABC-type sugar transport system permease subunit
MVGERGLIRAGWLALFLAPGLCGLLIFTVGSIVAALVLTLFQWDLLTPPRFIGLGGVTNTSSVWPGLHPGFIRIHYTYAI